MLPREQEFVRSLVVIIVADSWAIVPRFSDDAHITFILEALTPNMG